MFGVRKVRIHRYFFPNLAKAIGWNHPGTDDVERWDVLPWKLLLEHVLTDPDAMCAHIFNLNLKSMWSVVAEETSIRKILVR